ncbi:Adenosine receptor A2a [Acropora cervicornis]|uniref:Adenosine receptor A2a n=1 Tax=Acropora cervicornis TaxID=6130 RepID=A0AAD9UZL3_ACRCE|nr:Adenosine receptor A2a [Acropora cervicornis]
MAQQTHFQGETNMNSSDNLTRNEAQPDFIEMGRIRADTIPALVMMVFILVINGGVILLISCNSHLRKTSNIILVSLAVSDFLVGLVGIPLLVTCNSTFSISICLSSTIFFSFIALSTISHIVVMTCDRYVYIIWAMRYHNFVNRSRVLAVLGFIWFLSLTACVRISWTWQVNIETSEEDMAKVKEQEKVYLFIQFTIFFAFPLAVMTLLDTRMLLLLRQQYQRIMKENLPAEYRSSENKFQKRQRKVVSICVFLLILYVTCWLPYFILDVMQLYAEENVKTLPKIPLLVIYYLRLCTPLVNPLLYTLRKPDLKKVVKSLAFKIYNRLRSGNSSENGTEEFALTSRSDSKS